MAHTRKIIDNPGTAGDVSTTKPHEGKLFLFGGTNERRDQLQLGVRRGGEVIGLEAAQGKGRADVGGLLASLGLDINTLGRFSTDIFGTTEQGGLQLRGTGTSDFGFFQGFSTGAGGDLTTGAGAVGATPGGSTAAALDPNSQFNIQARAEAAQGFGQPGGQVSIAGFQQDVTDQRTQITNEADLQSKREELTAAGINPGDFSQFISAPDEQGRLFFTPPPQGGALATLTSPTGEKRVVTVGSEEASRLLASGFTLGDKIGGGTDIVDSVALAEEAEIDVSGIVTDISTSKSGAEALGISKETINNINEALKVDTEATRREGELTSELDTLLGQLEGREAFRQEQLAEAGITEFKQNLTRIRNEIGIKTAALEQRLAEVEATPQTLSRQTGASAAARRVAQADLMFLNAQAQAMMNNVTFAQELAQDAVNAKYNPILETISIKQQQLNIISDIADKEQKEFITALNFALTQQANEVARLKDLENSINSVTIRAISAGITDPSVLNQIAQAGSEAEALQIMGTNIPQASVSGGVGGGVVTTTAPTQTFEEFIAQKEAETFQSIGGAERERLRGEFDQLVSQVQTIIPPHIQNLVSLVRGGDLTANQAFDEVPKGEESLLSAALAQTPIVDVADTLQNVIAREKSQQAIELKTHKGLNTAVGTTETTRGKLFGKVPITFDRLTGQVQSFIGGIQQLVSGLSLDALITAKSRGATFGALSDTEMQILSSSATQIGTWVIKDEGGNVIGYNIDEKRFKAELDSISKTLLLGQDPNRQVMPDGTVWVQQSDGSFLLIE